MMIPNRKQITTEICYEILMRPKNYFSIADEYVSLQKIFSRDTILEKLELWIEMIISPLIMIQHGVVMSQLFYLILLEQSL